MQLSQVDRAEEAEGRLLAIVDLILPMPCVANNCVALLDASIKKVDPLLPNRQPGAAVHPGSPFVKVRDHRIVRIVQFRAQSRAGRPTRSGFSVTIIEANVDVGIRSRSSSRVGTAQDNGHYDLPEDSIRRRRLRQVLADPGRVTTSSESITATEMGPSNSKPRCAASTFRRPLLTFSPLFWRLNGHFFSLNRTSISFTHRFFSQRAAIVMPFHPKYRRGTTRPLNTTRAAQFCVTP